MYSIFDADIGDYLHTGRNSETLKDVTDAFLLYFCTGADVSEEYRCYLEKLTPEKVKEECTAFNYIIEEHDKPLPEEKE